MNWTLPTRRALVVDSAAPVAVRQARPDDLPALVAIERQAHPTPWRRDVFERELDLDVSCVWAVCRDDEVVGSMVFWVVHDEVHLLNIAVDAAWRRRGVATAALNYLLTTAADRQASFVTLEVRENNGPALGLYESLGFDVMGRREAYYADTGEDAFIMTRVLV